MFESDQNDQKKRDFEAKQNLIGAFELLLKIDRRVNPHLYQKENQITMIAFKVSRNYKFDSVIKNIKFHHIFSFFFLIYATISLLREQPFCSIITCILSYLLAQTQKIKKIAIDMRNLKIIISFHNIKKIKQKNLLTKIPLYVIKKLR
jgi:hypothetical protein